MNTSILNSRIKLVFLSFQHLYWWILSYLNFWSKIPFHLSFGLKRFFVFSRKISTKRYFKKPYFFGSFWVHFLFYLFLFLVFYFYSYFYFYYYNFYSVYYYYYYSTRFTILVHFEEITHIKLLFWKLLCLDKNGQNLVQTFAKTTENPVHNQSHRYKSASFKSLN